MAIGYGVPVPKHRPRVLEQADKKAALAAKERACRKALKVRDGGFCRVCPKRSVHLHHLVLRSKGGQWTTANVVALCLRCHKGRHGGILYLSGNPDHSLYWEWLIDPQPGVRLWGYSHPVKDRHGPGTRFLGRVA